MSGNTFLDAITPVLAAADGNSVKAKRTAQKKKLASVLTIINRLLALTFTNTLERRKHRKNKSGANDSAETDVESVASVGSRGNTPTQSIPTTEPRPRITSNVYASPTRRRKGVVGGVNDANAATPRKGSKSKQRRVNASTRPPSEPSGVLVSRGSSVGRTTTQVHDERSYANMSFSYTYERPSTEFLGWRSLHPHEIARLSRGDFLILIIPGNPQRGEQPEIKSCRRDFRHRVIESVLASRADEFNGLKRRDSVQAANKIIEKENGLRRSGLKAIDLTCRVVTLESTNQMLL